MPYGDLAAQRVQRYAELADLDRYDCTIEEREEYEPHIASGTVIYAGVDYGAILEQAQEEADVLLWDGGNNDLPFYRPDRVDRARRPAPRGPRAQRTTRARRTCAPPTCHDQQDGLRHSPTRSRSWSATIAEANPPATVVKANSPRHRATIPTRSAASACSSSRTAPRSRTAG